MAGKKPAPLTPETRGRLEELLQEPARSQLGPKLRHAIADQLRPSRKSLQQQRRAAIDQNLAWAIDGIEKIAERMRKNDELPDSGGIEKAALAEYADCHDIEPGTLEKAIQRYNKRGWKELADAFRVPLDDPDIVRMRKEEDRIRREKSRQTRQAIKRKKSRQTPIY
jgi:hypothetical protein